MTTAVSNKKSVKAEVVKIIKGEGSLKKAILSFGERKGALQVDAHIIACSILAHVELHGDIRMVNSLLAAVGKDSMLRMNSLRTWFETFGKIKFEKGNPCYVSNAKTRLGDAMAKPFWKFKAMEGTVYQPLVMTTYIDDQIKKLEKDIKNTPNADHTAQRALIKALKDHSNTVATTPAN